MKSTILAIVFCGACVTALIAQTKNPRPQPVYAKVFATMEEFAESAAGEGCAVQTFTFTPPFHGGYGYGNEIKFENWYSGVMFTVTPGTEVCCSASEREGYDYCKSEEGEGPTWGVGVRPGPKLRDCVIKHGSVISFSFY